MACPHQETRLDKKRIAALAGVLYYLKDKEKKRLNSVSLREPHSMGNRWALYGRQRIMQMRSLVQKRKSIKHIPLPLFINVYATKKRLSLHRVQNRVIYFTLLR